MAMSVKRTTLTQYGLRILRNTSLEISWDIKADMLSEFCERMRDSGYNEVFRSQIIESILKGWDRMVAEQNKGARPINRPRSYEESERRQQKARKKTNWFKGGGYTSVLFCPWTPEVNLPKDGEKVRKEDQVREDGGTR